MLFFSLNFITAVSEKQHVFVPGPLAFTNLILAAGTACPILLVPGDGPWRQVELVSVSGECICGYAMWKKKNKQTPKVCVRASLWGNFTSFAQISGTCCRTAFFGANTLLLSLGKTGQWHICAVPRAFDSLGIPAWSCPLSWGHLPKQDLWKAVLCLLFEGFPCF